MRPGAIETAVHGIEFMRPGAIETVVEDPKKLRGLEQLKQLFTSPI